MKQHGLLLILVTLACLCAADALAVASPTVAHHSFVSEYDTSKPVVLSGSMTKLLWQNPHAFFDMDVKDSKSGRITSWSIELGSVNSLIRLGWTRNSLKTGDAVIVRGILAIGGGSKVLARDVSLNRLGLRLLTSSSDSPTKP